MTSARLVPWLVAAAAIPTLVICWILWAAPIDHLSADREALAARDFTVFWAAGRLATASAFTDLYNPSLVTTYLRDMFGPGMPAQLWPYPPPALLLAAPIAALPFVAGFLLYGAAGLASLSGSLRALNLPWRAVAAVLLSPAVGACCLAGQSSLLVSAALTAGMAALATRPRLAGALFGLLIIKPQFGLLAPVLLLARGRVPPFAAALVTAATLCALPVAAFGMDAWRCFWGTADNAATSYLQAPFSMDGPLAHLISVFVALRRLGVDLAAASAGQAVIASACAMVVWMAWTRPGRLPARDIALTLVASMASSPWAHVYDMPMVAIASVLLWPSANVWQRVVLALAWVSPSIATLWRPDPLIGCLATLGVLLVATQMRFTRFRSSGQAAWTCV